MFPTSSTKTFVDIYDNVTTFKNDYTAMTAFQSTELTNTVIEQIYYMLYARYGNNPITNLDENQFKYKLFMTIWQYAPTWLKRVNIQKALRGLGNDPDDLSDIIAGAKVIYNQAANPETEPSTLELEEINYINTQNTTNYKKSKMDAYTQLWTILVSDVTEEFINRFRFLFKKSVSPFTKLYVEEN